MYNRAEIIDQSFVSRVGRVDLPAAKSDTGLIEAGLTGPQFMDLFESQVMSRHLDLRARVLKTMGECFYTIGSAGHEGNAVWGRAFRLTDMAFVHYRSCAFMIQRAKQLVGPTPLYDTMLSFLASSEDPIAGGRHKVFGSFELLVPPQTSTIASHLPKALGAALSIGRAKDLRLETAVMPSDAVVFASFGDASVNHSTAVGAINSALWVAHQNIALPLVLICEDNGIGISVPTPGGWIETQYARRPGLTYFSCDGLNICDVHAKARQAAQFARTHRKPVFLHARMVRLLGHAGSDVESTYRTQAQIEAAEADDPLLHSARIAIENDLASPTQILNLYRSVGERVAAIGEVGKSRPKYLRREEVRQSLTACTAPRPARPLPADALTGTDLDKPLHLAKQMNLALQETLLRYPGAVVFGEDVAQKGGVYNVTEGLWKKFGPRRVFNSPLDEQTILGNAIGFAHNGFLPIPEIQFLAYVHNAEDQVRGEAATLAFFSNGQFTNGMVIRVAGLPYQKGFGGHFHNDNSLAVFRDIPGVIVAVPSNGEDAVRMWRTCTEEAWEHGRVVVFVEPIALYMTRDLLRAGDKAWTALYPRENKTSLGEFGVWGGDGRELTVVTYGNGYYLARQAAAELGQGVKVIDLRWIAPIDKDNLLAEIGPAANILVVDECRRTGGVGEWIVTALSEDRAPGVQIPKIKLVAADDCFIPLGPAAAAGLPSREEIIAAARAMREAP